MTGTHLHHEFVLPILGVAPVASSLHLAILMPYCAKGNIIDWIVDKAHFQERGRLVSLPTNLPDVFHFTDISSGRGGRRRTRLPSLRERCTRGLARCEYAYVDPQRIVSHSNCSATSWLVIRATSSLPTTDLRASATHQYRTPLSEAA